MRFFAGLMLLAMLGSPGWVKADNPVPVGVSMARKQAIFEELDLHGSLIARRVSRLSSEADGLVRDVLVDDGDIVNSNDVLVRLDQRFAAIAVDTESAKLQEAVARHHEAERRHAELERLGATKHVAGTSVAAAAAQMAIDAARVKQAAAELARSREVLARHTVLAPFNAVVGRKLVEEGEWVETNTTLLELVDIDVLRLEVPVPQFYFAKIDQQTGVTVRLDALPNESIDAQVSRKIPINDEASRTFRIRIDIPNAERRLAPGMSARVVLRLGASDSAPILLLPRDALVRKADGSARVWIVETQDGVSKATPRDVTTGRTYRQFVEIVEGEVEAGMQVIVRGNEILRPGQSVLVAEEHGSAH